MFLMKSNLTNWQQISTKIVKKYVRFDRLYFWQASEKSATNTDTYQLAMLKHCNFVIVEVSQILIRKRRMKRWINA